MKTARLPLVVRTVGIGLVWVVSISPVWAQDSVPSPHNVLRRTIDYFSRSGRTGVYTVPASRVDAEKVQSGKSEVPPAPEPVGQVAKNVRPYRRSRAENGGSATSSGRLDSVDSSGASDSLKPAPDEVQKRIERFRELFAAASSTGSKPATKQTAGTQTLKHVGSPFEPAGGLVHALHKTTKVEGSSQLELVSQQGSAAKTSAPFLPLPAHSSADAAIAGKSEPKTATKDGQGAGGSQTSQRPFSRAVHPDTAVVTATRFATRAVPEKSAHSDTLGTSSPSPEESSALSVPSVKNFSDAAPLLKLRWIKHTPVTAGRPCKMDLVVANEGEAPAERVSVVAYFAPLVRLTKVEPQPEEATDHLTWRLQSLAPGEQQAFHIELIPMGRGKLEVTAVARLTQSSSASFAVEEPLLALEMKGPKKVQVGDPASQLVVVSNPGTGAVHDVVLEAFISDGLEHPRGKHLIMNVGTLAPGQSRLARLSLAAVAGGEQTVELRARASDGLEKSTTATIQVLAPSLKVAVDGPSLRYVGRQATYQVTVTNDGGAASNNIQVTYELPEGLAFQQADAGGSFDPSTRLVRWFVGELKPGESRTLQVQVTAAKLGQFTHKVAVTCEQGVNVEGQMVTRVDGTPSLTLQVVDLEDPVEVGRQTQYEIRVSNDGTKEATNVALACELPEGVELVGAKGATPHKLDGRIVQFQPLPALPAGKTALFRLQVRGTAAGNHRLRARISSDSIESPLVVDELTKFYSE